MKRMMTITESKCARCGRLMHPADAAQRATCHWCRKVSNGEVRSLYDDRLTQGGVFRSESDWLMELMKDRR